MLLNYRRHDILHSSAVDALRHPAAKGNEAAVNFLIDVFSDPNNRPLWHMASEGLKPAAAAGNAKAKEAISQYSEEKAKEAGQSER